MNYLLFASIVFGAYLLGSIPFSFLVAKAKGVDLRLVGSGNIGGANVWRTCGFPAFVIAASLDLLKGFAPAYLAIWFGLPAEAVVIVGVAAILGHTFPIFLNFRGGKAVATGGGILLAIAPLLMLLGLIGWIIGFSLTRISSVGSLSAVGVVAIAAVTLLSMGSLPLAYGLFCLLICGFVIYLHRSNIQRLRSGSENQFKKLW